MYIKILETSFIYDTTTVELHVECSTPKILFLCVINSTFLWLSVNKWR